MEMSKQINKVTELTASKTGIEKCRQDFPALAQSINEHPLVYLDSAASAQQPQSVIDKVVEYQSHDHANVHRGVHTLSVRATEAYEGARDIVQKFINAGSRSEVVYTSGTTESINLVPRCTELLPAEPFARRQDPDHASRTPFEHRSLAARLRPDWRGTRGRSDQRGWRGRY
jgi:cysteine desulfurase/selenocysteine lyase